MSTADEQGKHYSIGENVRPVNYRLSIDTNLKTFKFKGNVVISAKVRESTKAMTLNAKELKIFGIVVKDKKNEQKATFSTDDKNEELAIKLKEPVSGDIEITIDYEGINNDKMYGFYRSSYTNGKQKGHILTSQFEAPNARAALPCFDEPEFKATYDVSLTIDSNLDAISNMPVKATKKIGKRKIVTFETTPIMSSYLLYLGVGKYDYTTDKFRNIKIRIITTPGKKHLAKMPMEFAKKILPDLEKYFGVKYPLPKLDFIAVPDFAAGAMENWGAITFREIDLLGDEKETAVTIKQGIAETMDHEMVHQWFGDLVTMKWWDDMWLNESFATFMSYKSVDRLYPEWKEMQEYYTDTITSALTADALKNTHPISVNVNTVAEIEELFDAIGYEKGGSVLYMLENFVGSEIFRKGLTRYLKTHSYSNATRRDLWGAIQEEAKIAGKNLPVIEIMSDWLTKPGYPLINVKRNSDGSFQLEQSKFTISGTSDGTWKVPVNYITSEGPGSILLDAASARINTKSEWIKLNYKQAGVYRVKYENYNLARVGKLIKSKDLDMVDACGVENDLFAFARSGMIKLEDYVSFVGRYCLEAEFPLNMSISSHLMWFITMGYGESFIKDAKRLSIKLNNRTLERFGWNRREKESTIDTRLRAMSISALALSGDKDTIEKVQRMFSAYVDKREKLDTNLRARVFEIVAFTSPDQKKFDMFLNDYKNEKLPEDKIKAVQALGMLGDPALVRKALSLGTSDKIRLQDSYIIPRMAAGNPFAKGVLFAWEKENWQALMKKFDPATRMLLSYVAVLGTMRDKNTRDDVAAFFANKKNMRDDIRKEVLKALEKMDANIAFIDTNRQA